jgi:hypothetical protein
MLDSLITALAAIGTFLTAYFMFPTFLSSALTISVSVVDVPGANQRGSKGEELQKNGYFLLSVELIAAPNAVANLNSIQVRGGKISENINGTLRDIHNMVSDRIRISGSIPHGKTRLLRMYVLPDDSESGELEVIVRYSPFRSARQKCPYRRTHYYGE